MWLVPLMVAPAVAQSSPNAYWDWEDQHHQRIFQMMRDMTDQMGRMTEQMSRADLLPDQQREMARMSSLMRRLSGLEARPALRPAEWERRMDLMRRQMGEMTRNAQPMPQLK